MRLIKLENAASVKIVSFYHIFISKWIRPTKLENVASVKIVLFFYNLKFK